MRIRRTSHFERSYNKAPKEIQQAFDKQALLLLENLRHSSLHAKKYDEGRDRWRARVTKGWRFYFTIEGDTYVLQDIMRHPGNLHTPWPAPKPTPSPFAFPLESSTTKLTSFYRTTDERAASSSLWIAVQAYLGHPENVFYKDVEAEPIRLRLQTIDLDIKPKPEKVTEAISESTKDLKLAVTRNEPPRRHRPARDGLPNVQAAGFHTFARLTVHEGSKKRHTCETTTAPPINAAG